MDTLNTEGCGFFGSYRIDKLILPILSTNIKNTYSSKKFYKFEIKDELCKDMLLGKHLSKSWKALMYLIPCASDFPAFCPKTMESL